MAELLFVYGTLRSQFENDWACALRAQGKYLGPASVEGSLFRVGDYPAYCARPSGTVHGEIYELADASALFTLLDDYEGDQFRRVCTALDDGREVWIYRCEKELPATDRIDCGDFSKA